jgi:iron complex outermembrane receptor protein
MRNINGAMLLRFHKHFVLAAALLGAGFAQTAHAQSSGTEAVEESMSEVVVSATRVRQIGMVGDQTAPKSRVSVTSEYLESQPAGQTLFQSINQIPGVNFTNTDAYGTSGGNLRIRGFDGSRVSVTFDGMPLNDSGNYALFTNQMLDPELVDRVDVNLGTTDVDSPTASATGGTVAYRSKRPADQFGGEAVISGGEEDYKRGFLRVDTGEWGSLGTKAYLAYSYEKYDKFKGPGDLEKQQINGVIRQDFENDDFITLGFHYNRNRNAFYRTASAAQFALFGRDYENLDSCTRDAPTAGVRDDENKNNVVVPTPPTLANDVLANPSSCTNYWGVRINPSNTGNIRMQSLWHLGEHVRLTFDPSWQYVLANGGGTSTINETPGTSADIRPLGNANVTGFDLNGDGDTLDNVRFYSPNTTNTRRWGANASLIWDINDANRLRFAYTLDRASHRQTGEWGYILADGVENVFGGNEGKPVLAADGDVIRGRDRFSIAELNQYALEWRGLFDDNKLTATVGVRAPYFKRELNQYCYTPDGGSGSSGNIGNAGGTLCTSRTPTATLANGNVTFQANPVTATQFIAPYSDTVKFDDILPDLGLNYALTENQQVYLSYAEGLSAPRTDNLYAVRRQPDGSLGHPTPESETTKAYDLGWRLNASRTIASLALYHIDYNNRIVSSFDPDLGYSVDRNVGDVKIDGADFQLGQRIGSAFSLTGSVSYNDSTLQDNIPTSNPAQPIPTKGKKLVETPKWTFAMRADINVSEDVHVGLQGKKVGDRFGTDLNDEIAPGYTVYDFDFSWAFHLKGLKKGEFQFNVINLLDEEYFGNISSGTGGTSVAFYSIGAPRTAMASLKFDF